MNCHYCTYEIGDDDPYLAVGTELRLVSENNYQQRMAHLSCALQEVNTVPTHPDKSGKWCSYNHPPSGKWCMLTPHGEDVKHELESKKV